MSSETFDAAKRKTALKELEHYFLYDLMQEMRSGLADETLLENKREKQYFESMLDDALSNQMAESGQFGLAKQVEQQLAQAESATRKRLTQEQPSVSPTPSGGRPSGLR